MTESELAANGGDEQMTRDEIMQMEAGPELDAFVAEKVMGVKPEVTPIVSNNGGKSACAVVDVWSGPFRSERDLRVWLDEQQAGGLLGGYKIEGWRTYPRYSTSIAAAWEVMQWARRQTFSKRRRFKRALQDSVSHRLRNAPIHDNEVCMRMEPEDICRAALIATLEDE